MHDLAAYHVGHSKVLVVGGCNDTSTSKTIEVKDLSFQSERVSLRHGGKVYFPPLMDSEGFMHVFFGYGDAPLKHERIGLHHLLAPQASVAIVAQRAASVSPMPEHLNL